MERLRMYGVVLFLLISATNVFGANPFVWAISSNTAYDKVGVLELCVPPSGSGSTYGYRQGATGSCSSPGPTLRFVRGLRYMLTFRNSVNLPSTAPHTNIHTHGFHISGDAASDDIVRAVDNTARCLNYNYSVPATHAGGLFWYHAHAHGATAPQVSGGAFGMLIVEDYDGSNNYPELSTTAAQDANIKLFLTSGNLELFFAKIGSTWYVNGATSASVTVTSGQWHRFRIANSDPNGATSTLGFACVGRSCTNNCVVRELARDGFWRSLVPVTAATSWALGGASRIDLAVRCTGTASHRFQIGNGAIATVVVSSATQPSTASPLLGGTSQWSPVFPPYMPNMLSLTPSSSHTIQMQASAIKYDSTTYTWNPTVPCGTLPFASVVQFTVGGSGAHPFHLHAYPMQIINTCSGYTTGEFYDTISSSSSCSVRFKTSTVGGRVPMHCHFLSHEDTGAMTWLNVTGGPVLSGAEIVTPYTC